MTKISPKNSKLTPLFSPQKIQNYHQIIQKRPQTLQKDLKNENKGLFVIFGFFFVFF
jgi:cytochrome P450